ncbi:MAG: alpha/beta hydrolase [Nakamurella sp.]
MIRTAEHDGLQIAYELLNDRRADATGEPLLLIMGHLGQMVGWPTGFCTELTARGFDVARFDNRDFGLSGRVADGPQQSRIGQLLHPRVAYRLDDMVGDTLSVLDDLGWSSAHLVGISMGGMIAQRLAVTHPDRVRSLTSIMSTPSPRIGKIRRRTLVAMVRLGKQQGRPASADDVLQSAIAFSAITGSPGYPIDIETLTETIEQSLARDPDPFGFAGSAAGARQRAAIRTSGDRRRELAGVRAPTLVVHGDRDVMIRPAGGRATATAIPHARLVRYPGMGHDLPRALWPAIADEIAATAGVFVASSAAPGSANQDSLANVRAVSDVDAKGGVHAD